jgi:hypothetical protein
MTRFPFKRERISLRPPLLRVEKRVESKSNFGKIKERA